MLGMIMYVAARHMTATGRCTLPFDGLVAKIGIVWQARRVTGSVRACVCARRASRSTRRCATVYGWGMDYSPGKRGGGECP
jgi:hypothetical protein